jgi:hypothetical protein
MPEVRAHLEAVFERLSKLPASISTAAGLTGTEVRAVEDRFGFRFPPDVRAFLQYAMPIGSTLAHPGRIQNGKGFPNWRDFESTELHAQVEWPSRGVLFDVRESGFWLDAWGRRPNAVDDAVEVASLALVSAPKLIPLYGHRYICEEPHASGNPIVSVWQTDVMYYGSDLANWVDNEFFRESPLHFSTTPTDVPFWSGLIG